MTETLLLEQPQAELPSPEEHLRVVQLGKDQYQTDLPEGFLPLSPDGDQFQLDVEVLDTMPEGDFTLRQVVDNYDPDDEFLSSPRERQIGVMATEVGKAFTVKSMSSPYFELSENMHPLMEQLGCVFNTDGHLIALPTPDTIAKTAKEFGLNIKLMKGHGHMEAPDYLGAYAEGFYPIATGTEYDYKHDIQDDHLTAMIFGGEALRDELQRVASEALAANGAINISHVTADLDQFTAVLRVVLAPSSTSDEAFGEEKGRATLYGYAANLGISAEKAAEILAFAQNRAKQFGVEVKDLK